MWTSPLSAYLVSASTATFSPNAAERARRARARRRSRLMCRRGGSAFRGHRRAGDRPARAYAVRRGVAVLLLLDQSIVSGLCRLAAVGFVGAPTVHNSIFWV